MQFKNGIFVGGIILLSASGAMAETVTQGIARQLGEQGYTRVTISRTLLGRSRIFASGPNKNREIVVNPRTGEILRDFRSPVTGMPTISDGEDVGLESGGGGSGSGSSDSDSDDDDDEGETDARDDASDDASEGNDGDSDD